MLSFRSFTRSAPRAVSRLTRSATKYPAVRRFSPLQSPWKPVRTQCAATFSTSPIRKEKAGEGDDELAAKLDSEIQMENEMKDAQAVPTSVKDEEDAENINQGDKNFKVAPEDSIAAADQEEVEGEEEREQEPSFPARVNIIVEKPGKGALAVETVAQDGMVVIDNVFYYTDASHAHAKTAEKDHDRRDMYVGPPFGNLDEDLQVLLERYLDERGINTALAIFVPDYIDMKEQREYLRWLENVKGFVGA